jgi:hypothetical protein
MKKENKNNIYSEGVIVILIMILATIGMFTYPVDSKKILLGAIVAIFVVGIFRPVRYKAGNSYNIAVVTNSYCKNCVKYENCKVRRIK